MMTTTSEKAIQAVFMAPAEVIDQVYGPERRLRIARLTGLYPKVILLTTAQLDSLPHLCAVFYAGGSVQYFARPLLERGILVTSAWLSNAIPVAEFTLAQILLACKGYWRNTREYAEAPSYAHALRGPGNYSAEIALLGAGAVEHTLIGLLRLFHLRVLVFDPFLSAAEAEHLGVDKVSLEEAFVRGFVVSNHLADNDRTAGMLGKVRAQARATTDAYTQFISSLDNTQGAQTNFTLAQEDFITYRDPYNPNAGNFTVGPNYLLSDPDLGVPDPLARCASYNGTGGNSQTQYLKNLGAYEAGVRNLTGVSPATLTPLPGEPGQPNHAWVDAQTGAAANYYHGERFYLNADWRNYDIAGKGSVSNLARIHDSTRAVDRAALVFVPCNSATLQSDGNLSGTVTQPWVVRYGNFLILGNKTSRPAMLNLPAGEGMARDLLAHRNYPLGSRIIVKPYQDQRPGAGAFGRLGGFRQPDRPADAQRRGFAAVGVGDERGRVLHRQKRRERPVPDIRRLASAAAGDERRRPALAASPGRNGICRCEQSQRTRHRRSGKFHDAGTGSRHIPVGG